MSKETAGTIQPSTSTQRTASTHATTCMVSTSTSTRPSAGGVLRSGRRLSKVLPAVITAMPPSKAMAPPITKEKGRIKAKSVLNVTRKMRRPRANRAMRTMNDSTRPEPSLSRDPTAHGLNPLVSGSSVPMRSNLPRRKRRTLPGRRMTTHMAPRENTISSGTTGARSS